MDGTADVPWSLYASSHRWHHNYQANTRDQTQDSSLSIICASLPAMMLSGSVSSLRLPAGHAWPPHGGQLSS